MFAFWNRKNSYLPLQTPVRWISERINRTLKQMLSGFANVNRNDWDDHLPYLLMAYRATVQDSLAVTPHKMMFGRDMQCPIDLIAGNVPGVQNEMCPVQYIEWLKYTLEITYEFVSKQLGKAASRQKKHYDRGVKPRSFSEGDYVWRWYPPRANVKFRLGWIGPYLVRKKITFVTYQLQKDPHSTEIVVHIDHLKPYTRTGRDIPEVWRNMNDTVESESSIVESDRRSIDLPAVDLDATQAFESISVENEEIAPVEEFITPPRRTRCGRRVNKPQKYSPS